jgi:hypothetical protein
MFRGIGRVIETCKKMSICGVIETCHCHVLEYMEWLCFGELNVNVKQNLNEYIGHESLTLSDVETPMMKNFKHAYVSQPHFGQVWG